MKKTIARLGLAAACAAFAFTASAQDYPSRPITVTIGLAAGSIAGWLAHSPQAVAIRRALAVAIALAAIWFFYSTGHMK